MSLEQRLSFITLGVADVARSRAFFEALGWKASAMSNGHVTFFQVGSMGFSLYGREALAEDAQVSPEGSGYRGVTIAVNGRSREDADRIFAAFLDAGATLLKPMQAVFWGGYSGYVADLDGHHWEIAHNPFVEIDASGALKLP